MSTIWAQFNSQLIIANKAEYKEGNFHKWSYLVTWAVYLTHLDKEAGEINFDDLVLILALITTILKVKLIKPKISIANYRLLNQVTHGVDIRSEM